MKFRVVLEYDARSQSYSAVCPELPGCALRPLPPQSIEFIAEQRGFVDIKILRLHKMEEPHYIGQKFLDNALHRLNMEQDYSILARKP